MSKDTAALETRVKKLEATAKDHEGRIASLEARLEPSRLSTTALDLLLRELDEQFGKEDK